jgi:hypothetical protein
MTLDIKKECSSGVAQRHINLFHFVTFLYFVSCCLKYCNGLPV